MVGLMKPARRMAVIATFISLIAVMITIAPVAAVPQFLQGFETDTAGWFDNGGTTTRVASGTSGIPSSSGAYHGVISGPVFTRWGGYESVFPQYGFTTSIDVYLDMALADGVVDKRFDFSSAISAPDGNHRRDFIFHLGTNPSVANQWLASASNNAPGWPGNPARNPVDLTATGWYTLRHTFEDDAGVLKVTLDLIRNNVVIGSWVLSDPTDVIGTTVGGSRYGWFTSQRFDFASLAIDNSSKETTPPPDVVGESTYDLCVHPATGQVLSTIPDGCPPGLYLLATPSPDPIVFCISPYSNQVFYLNGNPCPPVFETHVIPADGDMLTCVSGWTGAHRWVANHAQCSFYEMPNTVPVAP